MDSAFEYFTFVFFATNAQQERVYECHVCYALVMEYRVPAHFSIHGLA